MDGSEHLIEPFGGTILEVCLNWPCYPPVAVEHLSDVPKSACAKITNDVRKRAAFLINEAWDSLAWDATDEDMLRFI